MSRKKNFYRGGVSELLKDYDLITTKRVVLNNSYHYGFATNHNIHALDMTGEVIKRTLPGILRYICTARERNGNVFWQYDRHIEKMV